jgi:hypothetical protein
VDKDVSYFRPRRAMKRGYTSWCRDCENLASKKRYIPKPAKPPSVQKPYDTLSALKRMLKSRYSITYEEYLCLYEEQNGMCAICGEYRKLGGADGLYIDHDHKNGRVRGLLCPACNAAIGMFNDDVQLIQKAIGYLAKSVV